MWRFSYWDTLTIEIESMKVILEGVRHCLMKASKDNEDAFRHAVVAFEDREFIDAFSKYKIIRKNDALLEAFAANESDPEHDRHSYELQQQQVIAPLKKGVANFNKRYDEFERLEEKTKHNELNLLLQQDFNKLYDMKPLEESDDAYKIEPLEAI